MGRVEEAICTTSKEGTAEEEDVTGTEGGIGSESGKGESGTGSETRGGLNPDASRSTVDEEEAAEICRSREDGQCTLLSLPSNFVPHHPKQRPLSYPVGWQCFLPPSLLFSTRGTFELQPFV